jgi:hypothetical protein
MQLDYIIGVAIFILVVAIVTLSAFQSLSPFYLTAKADQLSMVSDDVAQSLLSGSGSPPNWGSQLSLPQNFQLGLAQYNTITYSNTGGVGFYTLDPNKLSRLCSSNPNFIPYSSFYSGFSQKILSLNNSFYSLNPSVYNSLSSLGLSNFRFNLQIRPPYQFVVSAKKSGSSLLFNVESSTWNDVPIPGVQYSLAAINSTSSKVLSRTTNGAGLDNTNTTIASKGVYIIMGISETKAGLWSFSFTSLNASLINPMFNVVCYTQKSSTYGSGIIAYVWNTSKTPVLINSAKQSQWNVYIKAAVLQPNGVVLGPSNMTYNSGGFWVYNYSTPLSGPYLPCVLAFNNKSAIASFGWNYVSDPMMPDYGLTNIPYNNVVELTRYVTVCGTVYQALIYCWDPKVETSKATLSASSICIGTVAACPIVYIVLRRTIKKRVLET